MKNKKLLSLGFIILLVIIAALCVFGAIDLRLYVAYATFFIALILTFGFFLYNMVVNFKKNLPLFISIVGIIALLIIYYFLTPRNDVDPMIFEKTRTSLAWSPIIGAGLYFLYTLLGLFTLILIFFSIKNLNK